MNGYFAVQLDKSSCNVVKKRATFPNVVSDHITNIVKLLDSSSVRGKSDG